MKHIKQYQIFESKSTNTSEPWKLNKQQWIDAGQPDCGVRSCNPELKNGIKEERKSISDYFKTFEDPIAALKDSEIGVPRKDMDMKTRDKVFAKKSCWSKSKTSIGNPYIEDAREAIIIGRLLGYAEKHILGFVFRNYVLRDVFGGTWEVYDKIYKRYKNGDLTEDERNDIKKIYPTIKI